MKKTLLTIAATIAITTSAQAKEINLECGYIGVDGSQNSQEVTINTDLKQMALGDDVGPLISSGDHYGTTIPNVMKYQVSVNRSDLSWIFKHAFGEMKTTGCNIVEKKNQI
jgi:hypothetical protein